MPIWQLRLTRLEMSLVPKYMLTSSPVKVKVLVSPVLPCAFSPAKQLLESSIVLTCLSSFYRLPGFVSYDSVMSAEAAIEQMNGFQIGNKRLKVQHKRVHGQNDEPIMSQSPVPMPQQPPMQQQQLQMPQQPLPMQQQQMPQQPPPMQQQQLQHMPPHPQHNQRNTPPPVVNL
jgi:RNA recognition motif-containing protein